MTWRWPWVLRSEAAARFREESSRADAADSEAAQLRESVAALRRHADTVDAVLKETEARHEREMVRAETRYADLMASYRTLRLQGHVEATPVPTVEPPKIDPVIQAVNAASAGLDGRVRAAMLRQVAIDRKADLSDEAIIDRIRRGNRPAEEFS